MSQLFFPQPNQHPNQPTTLTTSPTGVSHTELTDSTSTKHTFSRQKKAYLLESPIEIHWNPVEILWPEKWKEKLMLV